MTTKSKLLTLQTATMDSAEIAQKALDVAEQKGLYDADTLEAMLAALEKIAAVPEIFADAVR
tara:strand:+ start:399 stop:584 length:186 start_codon:yes stop_codon:yes gene_type:complete